MGTDPTIIDKVSNFLVSPQVQSALIAAVVSMIVARLTTRRDRRARRAQRATELIQEVYAPLDNYLLTRTLYGYVSQNKNTLQKNRHRFTKEIIPLIDTAIREHFSLGITLGGGSHEEKAKVQKSLSILKDVETNLRPLLKKEITRLEAIIYKESG